MNLASLEAEKEQPKKEEDEEEEERGCCMGRIIARTTIYEEAIRGEGLFWLQVNVSFSPLDTRLLCPRESFVEES